MHRNVVWIGFLTIVLIATLSYMGIAGSRFMDYRRLQMQVPIETSEGSIIEESDSAFVLVIDYTFRVNGEVYSGKGTLIERPFLNRWAATQALTRFESRPQTVWIDPKHPEHHSLIKKFPLREVVYAIVLLALLLYFLWLGRRIRS